MTLDFVTLIAILFKLQQWPMLLRSSESVEKGHNMYKGSI